MPTKKKPSPAPTVKSKVAPSQLQNLAARPSFDDLGDEPLVDHSGVFRVTSSIRQAQTGHDEEPARRFASSDSLSMPAQREPFLDDGPTFDESLEEPADEATVALRKERAAMLAARAQALRPRR